MSMAGNWGILQTPPTPHAQGNLSCLHFVRLQRSLCRVAVQSLRTDARVVSVSTMKDTVFAIFQALLVVYFAATSGYGQRLSPPAINIAQGKKIEATSTCGEDISEPELFCKLATVPGKLGILGLSCDHCDPSVPSRDHSIEYAIDGTERWWQSPPLSRGLQYQRVNITIDLGQVKFYHRPRYLRSFLAAELKCARVCVFNRWLRSQFLPNSEC